ncbi:MAG: nickel pincer cofactor biosynthesis protein LarC [Desulfobacterales bacterium]
MIRAFFDCFSGISGDMTIGAFIDLGVPLSWLKNSLSELPLNGFNLDATPVFRHGINAIHFHVKIKDNSEARDCEKIKSLIINSGLAESVKKRSISIFERISKAEAEIHGCRPEEVHFHEVGGIDAIVDVVGTALCVEYLNIGKITSSELPLGRGFVSCRHGTLPVPSPATVSILKGLPVYGTDIQHELVTPTGAAIIADLAEVFEPMPNMIVDKIGYGAGNRDLQSRPNLLRIITFKEKRQIDKSEDTVTIVETCIDDMNPEIFGFIMERLFEKGALDVYFIPVFMKKNRPGTMLQVLCPVNRSEAVINAVLTETTSAGIRYYNVKRAKILRKIVTIKTSFGKIEAKSFQNPSGEVRIVPEYEVCRKIALERNIPIQVVYNTVAREAVLY